MSKVLLPQNSDCVQFKLTSHRYYVLLDDSPAYVAAVALNPDMKYEYFEQEWADKPAWIDRAKKETSNLAT